MDDAEPRSKRGLIAELSHRHVWRAAVVYVGAVWALSQGIAQLGPVFGLSDWVTRWFVIACAIGFPFWIAFAWYYKFTPQGLQRESGTAADDPALRRATGRKLDFWIIGVMAVAIVLLITNQFVLHRDATGTADAAGAKALAASFAKVPGQSVAVLPFENLSPDTSNAYFADGMQDLILTKLADIGGLKVISRTSTQGYGSRPGNLSLVGAQLGVATVLEGSVQKAGNQVLINVQLIDAKTDSHIWAQSYQRTLDNVFGVEGEVAQKVATALNAKLTQAESARVAEVPTHNQAAYDAFLQGEYYAEQGTRQSSTADFHKAFDCYRKAVAADPAYALAWAQLARRQLEYMHFFGAEPGLAAQAKTALERALTLQPQLEEAHVAQGLYRMFAKGKEDLAGASAAFAIAHALKPQDWFPIFLGGIVQEDQGHWDAAIASFGQAGALNPRQLPPLLEMAFDLAHERRYAQAVPVLQHALAVDPESWHPTAELAEMYALMGDLDGMQSVLDAAPASVMATPYIMALHARYLIYRRDWAAAHDALLKVDVATPRSAHTACLLGEVADLAGDSASARTYYERCAELATKSAADAQPGYAGLAWVHLGKVGEGLALGRRNVAESASGRMEEKVSALLLMARIEAHAGLAGDAVATLDRLLSMRGSASFVSAPLLEIDPTWDAIRNDPAFQSLLKKHMQPTPAVSHAAPPASASSGAGP